MPKKRDLNEQLNDAKKLKEMYLDLARQCDREIIDIELKIENTTKGFEDE